jgi:hypothetical protein
MDKIGRLKHSISERCPECGKVLQVRVRKDAFLAAGIEMQDEEEYICCSNPSCCYEREILEPHKRKERPDKIALLDIPVVEERGRKNGRYSERGRTEKSTRWEFRKGNK